VCNPGQTVNCPQIEVPSGGNELLLLNSEARIPLPIVKGLGLVVFYDGGNVFPMLVFTTSRRFTATTLASVALRNAGRPIRVDIDRI